MNAPTKTISVPSVKEIGPRVSAKYLMDVEKSTRRYMAAKDALRGANRDQNVAPLEYAGLQTELVLSERSLRELLCI
jgi:hypothetical protein